MIGPRTLFLGWAHIKNVLQSTIEMLQRTQSSVTDVLLKTRSDPID